MKQNLLSLAAAFIIASPAAAIDELGYDDHMRLAGEAFQSENWSAVNIHLDHAQEFRPYSLFVWRNRILARQMDGRTKDAIDLAQQIADRGLSIALSGHDGFTALAAEPEFAPVAAQMEANLIPIGRPEIYLSSDERELLPEAVTFDRKGTAIVGSVRTGKIIEFSPDSEPAGVAFANGGVFDLELRGNRLWAAVNNQLAYEGANPDEAFSALVCFNRKTGAITREVLIREPDALIGDIEVAKDGTIYASDSLTPRIFYWKRGVDAPEIFSSKHSYVNLQGIALDEKNDRLFVADYLTGLYVVDINSGDSAPIQNRVGAHLGGIDGLYLHDGELIGIQNGTTPQRIVRMELNDDATEVVGFDVLQQGLPDWNEPTHGAVNGDAFQYIATSNWPAYDADWSVNDPSNLHPLKIMTIPLDRE